MSSIYKNFILKWRGLNKIKKALILSVLFFLSFIFLLALIPNNTTSTTSNSLIEIKDNKIEEDIDEEASFVETELEDDINDSENTDPEIVSDLSYLTDTKIEDEDIVLEEVIIPSKQQEEKEEVIVPLEKQEEDTSIKEDSVVFSAGDNWYTSSFHTAKYYYHESCQGWQGLSESYLKVFNSEEELLNNYKRILHPDCNPY